jgi:hypothetical protein
MTSSAARYAVNQYTPDPDVVFDRAVGETYVKYAHRMADRGYVQSSLGGMVIRGEAPWLFMYRATNFTGMSDRVKEIHTLSGPEFHYLFPIPR